MDNNIFIIASCILIHLLSLLDVWGGDGLEVTPSEIYLKPRERALFRVEGGTGEYRWTAKFGDLESVEGERVIYKAPRVFGEDRITVYDSAENKGVARVIIPRTLAITPSKATVRLGESVTFFIVGGSGRYSWYTDSGTIKYEGEKMLKYVPPEKAGDYSITVTDETMKDKATAKVKVYQLKDDD